MVFLGSSGVGKSTIVNTLFGNNLQETKEVSNFSGKGIHTTSSSDLIFHDSGAMMIDTPGMRELQLWAGHDSVDINFEDIREIAEECKFKDCRHISEPKCAVKKAVSDGVITEKRLKNYLKQHSEISLLDQRRKEYDSFMVP